ncbi:MAG: hypothetical protein AAGG75_16220, partial [Bacteroidota bacterium]
MKKIILALAFSVVIVLNVKCQKLSFYDSGNAYGKEISVAQEALYCLSAKCISALKRTGFMKEHTNYNSALLGKYLDSLNNHVGFESISFWRHANFREDIRMPELTFYRTFYIAEEKEEKIFFQINLELAYESGLLYAKEIIVKMDDFFVTPKENIWDISYRNKKTKN